MIKAAESFPHRIVRKSIGFILELCALMGELVPIEVHELRINDRFILYIINKISTQV